MKVVYIGRHLLFNRYGIDFPKGVPVEVEEKLGSYLITRNSFIKHQGLDEATLADDGEDVVVEDSVVDDGEGGAVVEDETS